LVIAEACASTTAGCAREAVAWRPEIFVSSCDHRVPADWQLQSAHTTSLGTVAYPPFPCGAWLVLLDGQRQATTGQPRQRTVSTTRLRAKHRPRGIR
jgi:hypothetical protein